MKQLSRVVWTEGMHLAQHHFQLQSRYFEDSIQFALGNLFFKPYGLAGCELDAEALRNGTVSLIHARGVMPDGLPFYSPENDPAPGSRQIRELFSPVQDSHVIYLAIPPYQWGSSNCVPAEESDQRRARYVAETTLVPDETTGADERSVSVGRRNLRLVLDAELGDGLVSLPLARVRRGGAGHFVYDPKFIPPCLQIGASERLMQLLQRLVEILDTKSDAMAAERPRDRPSLGNYAGGGVASFWLLHAIRSSAAPLRHHLQMRRSHPEQLYVELARLAGALCTFSLDAHPRTVPPYGHDQPEECFDALDRHIRAHLEIVIPTGCVSIPLSPMAASANFHSGAVTDQRCLGRSRWVFGIRSGAGDAAVIADVPRLVKISSGDWILKVVGRAVPGLTLEHLPVPPAAISPRIGNQYFAVTTTGNHWNRIVQTQQVGVYVPDSLPGAELELLAVVEE